MISNKKITIIIILAFAFLLRIWNLDKPEGLWNDEYVSWFIASQKDLWVFFTDMIRNCHTPLYYLYLKLWMFLFGDSDITLRYSSVIPSLLSVFVMYLAGKETKNKHFGYLCAFITAISSFLIYFAQEVRLYSLLFLFTSLSVYYTIKVFKKPDKINMISQFLSCMLIVLTHTLGIIYVFLVLTFTVYYTVDNLRPEKKKEIIYKLNIFVILPIIAILILISPFLYNIATSTSLSQFWAGFSFAKILLCFTDYFSPVQSNIINTADTFSTYIYNNGRIDYIFIIFALIPSIIALFGIFNAIKHKNKKLNYLFLCSTIFFIYLVLISYTGRMVLITKYTIELYPAYIIIFAYGLYKLNNKKIRFTLISLYIILNLFYIFTSSDAAQKRTRPEGHRTVVELLKNSRLKNNDYVLLTYYDIDKFERYLENKNKYNFHSINKFNFNYYLYNNPDYKQVINSGKYIYKNRFYQFPDKKIKDYTYYTFEQNMKKGDRIGIVFLDNVSFFSNENIQQIISDDNQYNKTPYIFLVFSYLKNNLFISFKDNYKIDSITQSGDWTLVVFQKKN